MGRGAVAFLAIAIAINAWTTPAESVPVLPTVSSGVAQAVTMLSPRRPFAKPTREDLFKRQHDDSSVIKLVDRTGIRVRGMRFIVVESLLELERAERYGLTGSNLDAQVESLNDLLRQPEVHVKQVFTTAEATLTEQRRR